MKILKIIIFSTLFFSLLVFAENKKIQYSITNEGNLLLLKLTIPAYLNSELLDVLNTGIDLSLVYSVSVYKKSFPFSHNIFKKKYKKLLSYNVQSRIYSLSFRDKVVKSLNLKEILETFYVTDNLPLLKKTDLKSKHKYFCVFQVKMEPLKLYPPLSLVFSFIDIYNFKTAKYSILLRNEQ